MDTRLGLLVCEAAADVHAELGGGLSECVYQAALAIALRQAGFLVETEVVIPITYKTSYVGFLRPDLVVDKNFVIEVKAVQKVVESHIVQTRAYLRWLPAPPPNHPPRSSVENGAVINFGPERVDVVSVAESVPCEEPSVVAD